MNNIAKRFGTAIAAGATLATANAYAAAPDLTSLTSEVDLSTVGPAVLGVFAAIATVSVIFMAGRRVLRALK